ncbi:50S ribosomal protein L3-1, chloroplastic-like [Telopea speciosissima]|uniref:50S ribosomal protein L3-1, chloroplastic-like n=1 Tax=Telopea speciosissima TaxID=54955 RepID=UPI001CC67863|nr:50S ribosomal protein L3-1, chloroplastic-like [Telopea speciosissima]
MDKGFIGVKSHARLQDTTFPSVNGALFLCSFPFLYLYWNFKNSHSLPSFVVLSRRTYLSSYSRKTNLPSLSSLSVLFNPQTETIKQFHSHKSFTVVMSYEAGIGVMGTKLGMMTYFEPEGTAVPETVIGFREGNIVTRLKTESTDGYNAVQIGYRRVRDKKLTKPEMGHLNKAGAIPMMHLQEFRLVSVEGLEPNQRFIVDEIFNEGDLVDISGKSIDKGFQGGIKRHNFRRGPMTHGSKSHRALVSSGAGTTPGHVYKGKKMPGRMGGMKTKIRKLKIMKIDNELRFVIVKGVVPGKPGNLLRITPAKIVGKNIPKN